MPKHKPVGKSFTAYYDSGRKYYWIANDRGGWIEVTETSLRRYLQAAGYSPDCPTGQLLSPMDKKFIELQKQFDVAYACPLAGHAKGVCEISENRILVT